MYRKIEEKEEELEEIIMEETLPEIERPTLV